VLLKEIIEEITKILLTAENEETLEIIREFASEYIKQQESS
jgi:hypothetical protein